MDSLISLDKHLAEMSSQPRMSYVLLQISGKFTTVHSVYLNQVDAVEVMAKEVNKLTELFMQKEEVISTDSSFVNEPSISINLNNHGKVHKITSFVVKSSKLFV